MQLKHLLWTFLLSGLLASCTDDLSPEDLDGRDKPQSKVKMSGLVVDGPIINGTINAYEFYTQKLLATGKTSDTSGEYGGFNLSLDVPVGTLVRLTVGENGQSGQDIGWNGQHDNDAFDKNGFFMEMLVEIKQPEETVYLTPYSGVIVSLLKNHDMKPMMEKYKLSALDAAYRISHSLFSTGGSKETQQANPRNNDYAQKNATMVAKIVDILDEQMNNEGGISSIYKALAAVMYEYTIRNGEKTWPCVTSIHG